MWTTKPKTAKGSFSVLRFETEFKGNEDNREVLGSRSDALTFAERQVRLCGIGTSLGWAPHAYLTI